MASLALLLLAPLALAQTTTVQIPLFGFDEQAIDASVIGVTSQLTTYSLNCPAGFDSNDCGLAPTQRLTIGPGKYIMTLADADSYNGLQDCAITATTPAAGNPAVTAFCTQAAGGTDANSPGTDSSTYTDGTFAPIRVTAGASLLAAAQTGAGATTTSSGPTSGRTSGAASTGSTSGRTSGASTGAPTGSPTSAAAPANTNAAPALGVEVLGGLFGVAAGVAGLLYI
jgi:hypothetical protein